MRYVIAMICGAIFLAIAMVFISSPVASWVVRQYTFDSPDTVEQLHSGVFMLTNIAALLLGWAVGWMFSRRFARARGTL
ncbi:MAG: hypothetical protein AB7K67_02205 [Hyphomicrobiaceae bacterium]